MMQCPSQCSMILNLSWVNHVPKQTNKGSPAWLSFQFLPDETLNMDLWNISDAVRVTFQSVVCFCALPASGYQDTFSHPANFDLYTFFYVFICV